MEKSKITLNQILNFLCVLFIGIITVCYFATFWKFSGKIASVHDIVGFPEDNIPLQEFFSKKTGAALNMNSFILGPIVLLLGGIVGGIICAIKMKSTNNYIFNTLYGIIGIVVFSLSGELKLGTKWTFIFILFCLITLFGIIQILLKFLIKKEIGFDVNTAILQKTIIFILAIATFLLCIITTVTNLNYQKEKINNQELVAKYEKKDLISLTVLKMQIGNKNIDDDAIAKIDSLITEINNGTLKVENQKSALELLEKIKNGETTDKDKANIDKLFEELEKAESNINAEQTPETTTETETTTEQPEQQTEPATPTTNEKKSTQEIVDEVIKGYWGNTPERRQRLTEAGYDFSEIQKAVNKALGK